MSRYARVACCIGALSACSFSVAWNAAPRHTAAAQDKSSRQAAPQEAPPARPWQEPAATQPAENRLSRAELEKLFEERLTGALLKGTWRSTEPQGATGLAALGEAHDDQYTIVSVGKEEGDTWLFRARIEFAGRDVTLPIRLQVLWAGDTPIITVDDVGFPGLGVYSARVMVYGDFYSGVWSGRDHGGVLSGQLLRAEHAAQRSDEDKKPTEQPEPREPGSGG
jgi:hypothetical protein